MNQNIKLEISVWAIIKVILIIVSVYLLFIIRDIIALFFIVLVFTAAFRPIINKWEKKVGRILSVLIFLTLILFAFVLVIYLIVPPVISQSRQLIENIPGILSKYSYIKEHVPSINESIDTVSKNIGGITNSFVSITTGIFGGVIAFFAVFVMMIYLLIDKNGISSFIKLFIAKNQEEAVMSLIRKISLKVGGWFRGQLILGIIIGLLDFIGLSIIGAPYALMLAVISAIFEIVPTIGPLIAGTLAVLITLGDSPVKALFVLALYIVVQQIENSFIVPKVMQKAVGLSPVIIILAILIGAKLLGIVGAILAVPIAASISVIIQEWPTIRETFKKNE